MENLVTVTSINVINSQSHMVNNNVIITTVNGFSYEHYFHFILTLSDLWLLPNKYELQNL